MTGVHGISYHQTVSVIVVTLTDCVWFRSRSISPGEVLQLCCQLALRLDGDGKESKPGVKLAKFLRLLEQPNVDMGVLIGL